MSMVISALALARIFNQQTDGEIMSREKALTAKIVRGRLAEIKEQARKRQQDYQEQARASGRVRVNTYLTAEASEVLKAEREKGRSIADILSEAVLGYYGQGE